MNAHVFVSASQLKRSAIAISPRGFNRSLAGNAWQNSMKCESQRNVPRKSVAARSLACTDSIVRMGDAKEMRSHAGW
ncbi:hypothetical protein ACFWXH_05785 [Mesorhizobium sp. NPDC059054]|uniref:hypothetical protein n=1 Tax=unclassified Mesorhizobium TaxID=325217 RepID=UPI00128FA9B3|nr:hypothetical protein [Mesorhizobium sp. 1M-11]